MKEELELLLTAVEPEEKRYSRAYWQMASFTTTTILVV